MVNAILEGRKTQTRRIIKDQPQIDPATGDWLWINTDEMSRVRPLADFADIKSAHCPYGKVGDQLWVRETFAEVGSIGKPIDWFEYQYRADFPGGRWQGHGAMCFDKWIPSIFMPRDACRIMLEITDIRVERLNEIDDLGAIQEGVSEVGTNLLMYKMWEDYTKPWDKGGYCRSPKVSYKTLWEKINGPESWEQNPYVWVITFKRIK